MSSTNPEVLEALRSSFPQLFSRREEDGQVVERIDLEQIRLLAGDGNYRDRYGLRWETKPESFDADSKGKLPSLQRIGGQSLRFDCDKPTHVLIQGENFHALKVLAYTHERSVDVVYIDPPYNTGKDFVYKDNRYPKGKLVDRQDDFRHSKWLSFMHRRLQIAKTVLKDDGLLFISIDDNEVANLRVLCDELFPGMFVACLIRDIPDGTNIADAQVSHEYVLVYAKNGKRPKTARREFSGEFVDSRCTKNGNTRSVLRFHKGTPCRADFSLLHGATFGGAEAITVRTGNLVARDGVLQEDVELEGPWATPGQVKTWYSGARPQFDAHGQQIVEVYFNSAGKPYIRKQKTREVSSSVLVHASGSAELEEILGKKLFDYPKPTSLIKDLLKFKGKTAVVLDFFAGSGTTGHAVMQLNAEDGGTRQCILVTNDEGEFKDDVGNVLPGGICTHVTYPRLKKVIEGYTTPKGKEVAGLGENLEFFETAFQAVPRSRRQLQSFVRHSTSLLQLKAGCFTSVETNPEWSLHTDGSKHLFILFDDCAVGAAVERLRSVEGPVEAYVFAYDSDDDGADTLGQLPNVTVQEVPQPLLDLFFRIKE